MRSRKYSRNLVEVVLISKQKEGSMTKAKKGLIPALITTDSSKRGVFMGFIKEEDIANENIIAEEVRMAVYWSADVKGVLGLASIGPTKGCRISTATKKALIKGVTAVVELTPEAVEKWRAEPWG